MKPIFILSALILFYSAALMAQRTDSLPAKKKKPFRIGLEGMAGVSFGNNVVAFNIGGPHLKLNIAPRWSIGVGALPSLMIINGKAEPRLGLAPRVDYRNLVLLVPGYYMTKTEKWLWTVGLGYKFL